jgi:hypothetical protein
VWEEKIERDRESGDSLIGGTKQNEKNVLVETQEREEKETGSSPSS